MRGSKLHYLSVSLQKENVKKQSHDQKSLPKEIRSYNPFPKQDTFLLATDPWLALVTGYGTAMY